MVRRIIHTQSFINSSFIPSAYPCVLILAGCLVLGQALGRTNGQDPTLNTKSSGYAAMSIAHGSQGRGCLLLKNIPREGER